MLITFERKVPQSSYTAQNDHKSKGYPSKTSSAFTMQKSDKGDLKAPRASAFEIDFQKYYFSALTGILRVVPPIWKYNIYLDGTPALCNRSFVLHSSKWTANWEKRDQEAG